MSDDSRFLAVSTFVCPPAKEKGVCILVDLFECVDWARTNISLGDAEELHFEYLSDQASLRPLGHGDDVPVLPLDHRTRVFNLTGDINAIAISSDPLEVMSCHV